ncbi:MAG: 3-hydroxybutyryl-CoA dehydrogenase, partial [Myxococcales bacterium]|nr:3-hydroxybutyryl-CoA dehydrogenase [Myxococcales bacterium]
MEIERVGVIGGGLMGSGIAEVCARSGLATVINEVDQGFLDSGMS